MDLIPTQKEIKTNLTGRYPIYQVADKLKDCALMVFDLDGTLIGQGNTMSKRTKIALQKAYASGCILVLNTGRPQSFIPSSICAMPFSYIITSNGARTLDQVNSEVLSLMTMPNDLALKVLDSIDENRTSVGVHLDGQILMNQHYFRILEKPTGMRLFKHIFRLLYLSKHARFVKNIKPVLERAPRIEKLHFLLDDTTYTKTLLEHFLKTGNVEAVITTGNDLEITAAGINKGSALKRLCEHLSIAKEKVIAFGDSGNDLSMLSEVGCFIATENASDDVITAADYITLSAENDGVAVVLEELFNV
jgi:Cof subfamily protein (haloacid dehalogenase superfamily)